MWAGHTASGQHLCCCSPHAGAVQLSRVAWIRSFIFSQSRSANVPQLSPLTGMGECVLSGLETVLAAILSSNSSATFNWRIIGLTMCSP